MASTLRGNDMKIHVFAFAERQDGAGVDFMRLSYTKSAEVCQSWLQEESSRNLLLEQSLRGANCSSPSRPDPGEAANYFGGLLRRPDVARYAIALAFQGALESEGVHLHFCDARE